MHRLGFKRGSSPRILSSGGDKFVHGEALDSGENLSVAPRLIGQCGVPGEATVVVYDFYQRLLAIGTGDGRLKIVGADGVEALFCSPRGTATHQVGITAQGGVLRLSDGGTLELWSLPEEMILSFVDDESVECFTLIHTTPFLVLGTTDGSLRIAQIVLGAGDNPEDIKLLRYRVTAEVLAGSGSIISIAMQPGASMNKVLIGFEDGDISLWALYEKKLVVTGNAELQVNGAKLTDVQWLDTKGEYFVSGYEDGSLWVWSVPQEGLSQHGAPSKPVNVAPLCTIDYVSAANIMSFSRVISIRCGQAPTDAAENHLRIFAHGVNGDGMKAIVSIELDSREFEGSSKAKVASAQVVKAVSSKTLPWFGDVLSFCTIESISSNLELEISSVVSLAENSTIHIYDIEQYMPFQVDTPFQRCTPIECLSVERSESSVHSQMYRQLSQDPERVFQPSVLASGVPWPVVGGRATLADEAEAGGANGGPIEWGMMVTGHQDGVARVWDTGYNSVKLLGSFPSKDAPPTSSISCLAVSSNLVVLGYDSGEVRAFVSASSEKFAYEQLVIEEAMEVENVTHDGTPFACLIRSTTHNHEISALQCCVDLRLIACGDSSGTVSVIDLEGKMLFCGEVFPNQPVASVLLATNECTEDGSVHRCLVASSEQCSITLIDLDGSTAGGNMPEVVTPKNTAKFLYACLLDQYSHVRDTSASDAELLLPGLRRVERKAVARAKGRPAAAEISTAGASSGSPDGAKAEAEAEAGGSERVVEEVSEDEEDGGKDSSEDEFAGMHLDDASEEAEDLRRVGNAVNLLQCSSGYLRIYPMNGIARGDRTTWRKLKCEVPLQVASAVNRTHEAGEASCVVTLDADATLAIWRVPSFESYWSRPIADVLGWDLNLSPEETRISCSGDGQLVIAREGGEDLIRICLTSDERRNPLPSLCLHDRDVADATQAAIAALHASKREEEEEAKSKPSKFGSFMSNLNFMGPSAPPPAIQPSVQQLGVLFSEQVAVRMAATGSGSGANPKLSGPALSAEDQHSRNRSQLLGGSVGAGSSGGAGGSKASYRPPGPRSVEDIKAAYGRDPTKSSRKKEISELKGVMAENMNKLAERGERLNQISDKTQQLENEAEDFMTMAKKLAEREKNKKWWEF